MSCQFQRARWGGCSAPDLLETGLSSLVRKRVSVGAGFCFKPALTTTPVSTSELIMVFQTLISIIRCISAGLKKKKNLHTDWLFQIRLDTPVIASKLRYRGVFPVLCDHHGWHIHTLPFKWDVQSSNSVFMIITCITSG